MIASATPSPGTDGKVRNCFAAHFCEVEVNMKTMEVKILRYVATQDSGRVIFHSGLEGQVFGGVVQGIGQVISETRVHDRQTGKLLTKNMHDYMVPTIKDVPMDLTYIPIDLNDTWSNTGAKGGGEPPKVPPAATVANAVYNATGIRFTKTFINPIKLTA